MKWGLSLGGGGGFRETDQVSEGAVQVHARPDQAHMNVGSYGPVGATDSLVAQLPISNNIQQTHTKTALTLSSY